MTSQFAIGVGYGTNSVRALLVDSSSGKEIGACVFEYRSGDLGILLDVADANWARQTPADYIEGFYQSVGSVIRDGTKTNGIDAAHVVGIGIDTTGSTPIPVN